jgi:hypothetical protein
MARKIFFLVDDIIFIRDVDLNLINKFDAKKYVGSLRLGKNINYSFMKRKSTKIPPLIDNEMKDKL